MRGSGAGSLLSWQWALCCPGCLVVGGATARRCHRDDRPPFGKELLQNDHLGRLDPREATALPEHVAAHVHLLAGNSHPVLPSLPLSCLSPDHPLAIPPTTRHP